MGNAQSSEAGAVTEQVIRPQEPTTSVTFAPSLINQLANTPSPSESSSSDSSGSSAPPASSSHHDSQILSRLQAETARLRHEESQILSTISAALEKENLDKEKPGMSSQILSRDMEEVREKVEKKAGRRRDVLEGLGGGAGAEIKAGREAVVACYLSKPGKPLDCWKEVEVFKNAVGKLEHEFVASLRAA